MIRNDHGRGEAATIRRRTSDCHDGKDAGVAIARRRLYVRREAGTGLFIRYID